MEDIQKVIDAVNNSSATNEEKSAIFLALINYIENNK
jgi:hypothetical protein